ncbi:MAG: hypothetical protein JXA15_00395 [Spirochaetales bacterium]|nr:hypothetical protein [Spirochaetales bacterium]
MHDSASGPSGAAGDFVEEAGRTWYRIRGYDLMRPFLMALASDSDLWAYVSSSGSLAAGRRDAEGSFFPYETADRVHARWEYCGPRTWILVEKDGAVRLWEPFALRPGAAPKKRELRKDPLSARIRFSEEDAESGLVFDYEWAAADSAGLVRSASLRATRGPVRVRVLDGVVGIRPAGVDNATWNSLSYLADAYTWNEAVADGRLGLYALYAKIWDRAEPKENFEANLVWSSGPRFSGGRRVPSTGLLSSRQVGDFCAGRAPVTETLVRGGRGAFLRAFEAELEGESLEWRLILDGPRSQARVANLADALARGEPDEEAIEAALAANDEGVRALVARADGLQASGDPMAAAHHASNALFNIMRGGVFVDGTAWDKKDLLEFAAARNRLLAPRLAEALSGLPDRTERTAVMVALRDADPGLRRLAREYLPLTWSRRHGDPSRPWNRFSVRVRDEAGRRLVDYQGNWRDIFQNWEALLASEPAYAESFIATFLSAMTADGHNPYRIGRFGVDWEVVDEDDPWSYIGYWGDHQMVYLVKLLEAAEAREPGALARLWNQRAFAFADVPYRIRPYAELIERPKEGIRFDAAAHRRALARSESVGTEGRLVPGPDGQPLLASLAEKLVTILLAKAGNLVPGGGLWLNTQRPEWNDANNALAGWGLSLVSLAELRRFLVFLRGLDCLDSAVEIAAESAAAISAFVGIIAGTPSGAVGDSAARGAWMDSVGPVMDVWRNARYESADRASIRAEAGDPVPEPALADLPAGRLRAFVEGLLGLVDATLRANRRSDGLWHSYNLMRRGPGGVEVDQLYLMLEGQVAVLGSGLLSPDESASVLGALASSELYVADRRSYILYPDRDLPGFLERNVLDEETLATPVVRGLLAAGGGGVLERQADGTVRFAPGMANRHDVERALAYDPAGAAVLAGHYERLLRHREFTGRSGTMFGFEGLGSVYWHMVAKLLLAASEACFAAAAVASPVLAELTERYRAIQAGLGYRKSVAEYGAFPADPYSHTPAGGGAQQPGMTGQVKEELLARWNELGLRWRRGRLFLEPILLDPRELDREGGLEFTYRRVPFRYLASDKPWIRILGPGGWEECPGTEIPIERARSVEAGIALTVPLEPRTGGGLR